jgi:putative sigma-54 modulation protein
VFLSLAIKGRNVEINKALREYLKKKTESLKKYLANIDNIRILLYREKYQHICEVIIHSKGVLIKGKDKARDVRTCIDKVIHKIVRQLKRYKDKLKNHKPSKLDKELKAKIKVLDERKASIIKTSSFPVAPMAIDEAIMNMELANNEFYVFINQSNQKTNVVYKRQDGRYGLLEPGEKNED